MAIPDGTYAPPGVYSRMNYENATQSVQTGARLPILIGTGSEILSRVSQEIVRGSSSNVDQQIREEDATGRSVVTISQAGAVTLGDFNGERARIQVRKFPIVNGNGLGVTATKTSSVRVTINSQPVVVISMIADKGVLELSAAPALGDDVRVTYFFKRTDTRTTDALSDQVSVDGAEIYGEVGQPFTVSSGVNDVLSFLVDGTTRVDVTIPDSGSTTWSAAQVAAFVNAAAGTTSIAATTATNSLGDTVLYFTADRDLEVLSASGNSTFGVTAGDATARNRVFYTFQRPIVDGGNGGLTTTDPSDVSVTVDGVDVTATSVDGASGAVTLPFAPEVGAVVEVTYYYNAWQNTFDYLPDRDVLDVTSCGVSPTRSDFIEDVDFVLDGDKIVWGSAATVTAGETASGTSAFGEAQVGATLVDARAYLQPCEAYVDTSVVPVTDTRKMFILPHVPTSGNGRNSPLGSETFDAVANGRVDLPTDRPDLVLVYWGYSPQDALDRGTVVVSAVDSSTRRVRLRDAVPVGASVYATYYYNTLVDQTYTFSVESVGASGVGTYTVTNESGTSLLTPSYGTKSSGLSTITVEFPSGSERRPDVRLEPPSDQTDYTGPVEEDVRVTFASTDSTLAKYAVPGAGDYTFILNSSDRFRLRVDGADLASGSAGLDLGSPSGVAGLGFSATMVGYEVTYDDASGSTTYEIDSTNDGINLLLDGVLVTASATNGATQTLADFVSAINTAASSAPSKYVAAGRFLSTCTITSTEYDQLLFHYVGSSSGASGNLTATLTPGTYSSPSTLAAQVQTQVSSALGGLGAAFTGVAVAVTADGDGRLTFALTRGTGVAASGTITCSSALAGDTVTVAGVVFTADTSRTAGNNDFDISGSDIADATSLVAALNDPTNWVGDPPVTASNVGGTSAVVTVTASSVGTAGNSITLASSGGTLAVSGANLLNGLNADASGYLEFITHGTAKRDFCVLAGIDTAAATGGSQTKLVDGPVARRYTITGDATSALLHDRIILRSRVVPGYGSVYPAHQLTYAGINVQGGTGSASVGLTPSSTASAGWTACVRPATLLGYVGFSDGQVEAATYGDARDGQPLVTFYAAGGTSSQNNVLKFTMDGVPVTVVFTDAAGAAIASGASADVPLGPASSANTVLGQIRAAVTAAGLSSASSRVVQEGAAIRLISGLSSTSSSIIVGNGNGNGTLGFNEGDAAYRTAVAPDVVASALMSHSASSVSSSLNSWSSPSTTYFAAEALASVVSDATNAKYLFLQSQGTSGLGTSSSVVFAAASSSSALLPVTGLKVVSGDGAFGEPGISGFYVTSSDAANGSGTANTSLLNLGTGQDGLVGQTYSDLVTGLTFTILPRAGNADYPDGSYITFKVRRVAVTDSNLPSNVIPGLEVLVTSTSRTAAGNTALLKTFERGGEEPAVGDLYYVSYTYRKQDYATALFTRLSTIEALYGTLSPDNPVVLAAYLALLNGATTVGIKQVKKDTDANGDGLPDSASVAAFRGAVDELEGPLSGGINPDILVPLRGDSLALYQYMAKHADIQSDIRHRSERTIIAGTSAGTTPRSAVSMARGIQRDRFRLVYPDVLLVPLPNDQGQEEDVLVDGTFLAAMLVGSVVSPNTDVATPWTNRTLTGATQLARTLDAVTQNNLAVGGVTVIEDAPPNLVVRHGLTTDLVGASTGGNSLLSSLPTIVQISDEINRRCRRKLSRFIGQKFLPGLLSEIEKQLSSTLNQAIEDQIIISKGGVSARISPENPTVAEVQASFAAVLPLLYITITFNLKSQR